MVQVIYAASHFLCVGVHGGGGGLIRLRGVPCLLSFDADSRINGLSLVSSACPLTSALAGQCVCLWVYVILTGAQSLLSPPGWAPLLMSAPLDHNCHGPLVLCDFFLKTRHLPLCPIWLPAVDISPLPHPLVTILPIFLVMIACCFAFTSHSFDWFSFSLPYLFLWIWKVFFKQPVLISISNCASILVIEFFIYLLQSERSGEISDVWDYEWINEWMINLFLNVGQYSLVESVAEVRGAGKTAVRWQPSYINLI